MVVKQKEGRVKVMGFNLFYRSFDGEGEAGTVVGLHGGPGATHDYMVPLADLAEYGYRVVLYDQLGCGKSDLPKNTTLFTIERNVEELEAFRKALNLGKIHLAGHSYGGALAIAYALKYQRNLKSLISIGGLANTPLTIDGMERMVKGLPADVQATLQKYEDQGDYENPEYQKAVMVFYKRHLCRMETWPAEVNYSLDHISKPVYYTMNGPNEFRIIGGIRYWDVSSKLNTIHVPTLVIGGKYDEVSPLVAAEIHHGIKGSKRVLLQKSGHLGMWEERPRFVREVRRFLSGIN